MSEPRELAELLLERCRTRLSGSEVAHLEEVIRSNQNSPTFGRGSTGDGSPTHTKDYVLTRLCTEFAEHLK